MGLLPTFQDVQVPKVQGLKTHDCHILLQRILPAGMRGFLDSDIYEAIAELGKFFRELCSKTSAKILAMFLPCAKVLA